MTRERLSDVDDWKIAGIVTAALGTVIVGYAIYVILVVF